MIDSQISAPNSPKLGLPAFVFSKISAPAELPLYPGSHFECTPLMYITVIG